jgi:hypothetical protein
LVGREHRQGGRRVQVVVRGVEAGEVGHRGREAGEVASDLIRRRVAGL